MTRINTISITNNTAPIVPPTAAPTELELPDDPEPS